MSEIRTQENAIILACAQKLVSLGSEAAQSLVAGKESTTATKKGFKLLTVLQAYSKKAELDDAQIDSLLYCLRSLSEADYFPTTSPIVGKDLNSIINISGSGLSVLQVYNQGVLVGNNITKLYFSGDGVNATATEESATVNISGVRAGAVIMCGNWDASLDTFPAIGGTGPSGAIQQGNEFEITVAGSPSGYYLGVGVNIRAKIDNPGQTLANWRIYL